jgi:hypothetical protein
MTDKIDVDKSLEEESADPDITIVRAVKVSTRNLL